MKYIMVHFLTLKNLNIRKKNCTFALELKNTTQQ